MIKINLLPHSKRAKVSDTEKYLLLYLILLTIVCTSILSIGLMWRGHLSGLEDEVLDLESQRQILLTRVGRLNQLERKFEEIQANIEAIKYIRVRQQLPVRYVDETTVRVPEERMWFEALNLNRNGVMDIRGVAVDNQAFAGYVDSLRSSEFIRSVSTQRTSRREVQNLSLVEFQFQIRAGPPASFSGDANEN
ncbi:PilN domain-containing protein [Desulfonatronovibrio magnus]|uniref:PilN domain-containing protein n=1 Tax=Desulfonatronovibrio magnus TaxID=698827 RepID=UPI0005EBCCC2|nr:PilN domain-containing protein [Desulfonatronovibrio magnus]RQD63914.1 MAG: hypothetical protein D5R98_05115 [Desulfonatronovibrio sp. MSAO_Bac4]